MRKRIFTMLLACLMMVGAVGGSVHAESLTGKDGMACILKNKKLESNFTSTDLTAAASEMQPGDDVTYKITLENQMDKSYDWWILNEIITSFEDNSIANGGAYEYYLDYTDPSGTTTVIYDSKTVGGEDTTGGTGLHETTTALQNYIYLGAIGAGQSGYMTLKVTLDGETQGNDYQNTLAKLMLQYAVEETPEATNTTVTRTHTTTTTTSSSNPVKTGDETNYLPYILGMLLSGLILLLLALLSYNRYRKSNKSRK